MNRRPFIRFAVSALAFGGVLAAAPALAQEVVKIGYSGPLSGGAAQYGKNTLDGMKFAIDELNASGFEVAGKNFNRPVETYLVAAVVYFVICFSLSMLVRRLQKKIAIIR